MGFIKIGIVTFVFVLLSSTVSSASTRSKRSILDYGKWCGKRNTKLGASGCNCEAGIEKCRELYPPIDELDKVCLSHDWCSRCPSNPTVESYRPLHWCQCERDIYTRADRATCRTPHCTLYKAAVKFVFKHLPCVCEKKKEKCMKRCTRTIWGREVRYPCGLVTCEKTRVVRKFSKCQNMS